MRLTRPGARKQRAARPWRSPNARASVSNAFKPTPPSAECSRECSRLFISLVRGPSPRADASRRRHRRGLWFCDARSRPSALAENLLELFGRGLRLSVVGHQPVYLLLHVRQLRVAVAAPDLVGDDGFDEPVQALEHRLLRRLDAGVAPLVLRLRP